MIEKIEWKLGDIAKMKKIHPCGSYLWEIMRVGMDFRLKCLECGRVVMLPRNKFEKMVKEKVEK